RPTTTSPSAHGRCFAGHRRRRGGRQVLGREAGTRCPEGRMGRPRSSERQRAARGTYRRWRTPGNRASPALQRTADGRTLAEVERDYVAAALRASGGYGAKAAERLGIGVATLYRTLKQLET